MKSGRKKKENGTKNKRRINVMVRYAMPARAFVSRRLERKREGRKICVNGDVCPKLLHVSLI